MIRLTPWREVRAVVAVTVPVGDEPTVSLTVETPGQESVAIEAEEGRNGRLAFDDMLAILLDKASSVRNN